MASSAPLAEDGSGGSAERRPVERCLALGLLRYIAMQTRVFIRGRRLNSPLDFLLPTRPLSADFCLRTRRSSSRYSFKMNFFGFGRAQTGERLKRSSKRSPLTTGLQILPLDIVCGSTPPPPVHTRTEG